MDNNAILIQNIRHISVLSSLVSIKKDIITTGFKIDSVLCPNLDCRGIAYLKDVNISNNLEAKRIKLEKINISRGFVYEPSISFGDNTTGIYATTNSINYAINGVKKFEVGAANSIFWNNTAVNGNVELNGDVYIAGYLTGPNINIGGGTTTTDIFAPGTINNFAIKFGTTNNILPTGIYVVNENITIAKSGTNVAQFTLNGIETLSVKTNTLNSDTTITANAPFLTNSLTVGTITSATDYINITKNLDLSAFRIQNVNRIESSAIETTSLRVNTIRSPTDLILNPTNDINCAVKNITNVNNLQCSSISSFGDLLLNPTIAIDCNYKNLKNVNILSCNTISSSGDIVFTPTGNIDFSGANLINVASIQTNPDSYQIISDIVDITSGGFPTTAPIISFSSPNNYTYLFEAKILFIDLDTKQMGVNIISIMAKMVDNILTLSSEIEINGTAENLFDSTLPVSFGTNANNVVINATGIANKTIRYYTIVNVFRMSNL